MSTALNPPLKAVRKEVSWENTLKCLFRSLVAIKASLVVPNPAAGHPKGLVLFTLEKLLQSAARCCFGKNSIWCLKDLL